MVRRLCGLQREAVAVIVRLRETGSHCCAAREEENLSAGGSQH